MLLVGKKNDDDDREVLAMYCNRRNFRTRKNIALQRLPTFVRYKFSYSDGGVKFTCIRVWFSYATKFRTFRQKYEIYEIKSRTKICAITVHDCQHQGFRPKCLGMVCGGAHFSSIGSGFCSVISTRAFSSKKSADNLHRGHPSSRFLAFNVC